MNLILAVGVIAALIAGQRVDAQEYNTQCPPQWVSWQSYCYLFVNTSRITWDQSKDECANRLGHQLRIETLDEYNFIRKALVSHPSDGYWTALNDLPLNVMGTGATKGTGTFMWGSDETVMDSVVTNNWDHEPDNSPLTNCVAVDMNGACSVVDCSRRHAYICQIPKKSSETCPGKWSSSSWNSDMCYFVSNASDWSQTVTWDNARRSCEGLAPFGDTRKAVMLAITKQEVQTFLASQLSLVYYGRQLFWTGLNDKDTEGSFLWAGNEGTPYQGSFIKWRQEPNNLAGQEHCGVIQPGAKWGDRNCDDKYNYICRSGVASGSAAALFNNGCGQWSRAGQKCVFIYSYPQMSWQDSRAFCQRQNGDLIKFDSPDDLMWLTTQSSVRLTLSNYWIGLNDQQTEGTYVWADGSPSDPLLVQWDREPKMYEPSTGNPLFCAGMFDDGNFMAMNCWRQYAGAICEQRSSVCAIGWKANGGHCYLLDTKYRLRGEAADHCKTASQDGTGRLFALNSQAEKDWLVSQIGLLGSNGTFAYWSDLKMTGHNEWHWTDPRDINPLVTEKILTWNHEPNNFGGNEDCGQVNVNGMINDSGCKQTTGFICQRWAVGISGSGAAITSNAMLVFSVTALVSGWMAYHV